MHDPALTVTGATRPTERSDGSGALCVVTSDRNGRDKNEDAATVFSLLPRTDQGPLTVLAVADGMGGHSHGAVASALTIKTVHLELPERLRARWPDPTVSLRVEAICEELLAVVEVASARLRREVQEERWGLAGSTLVMAVLHGDAVAVANLGDSPLFHFRARTGEFAQVTQDHSIAAVLVRAGLISAAEARVHPGRSKLEFFIGGEGMPRAKPVHIIELEDNDLLFLCTDGVSGSLAPEDIARLLSDAHGDLDRAAEQITALARDAGETDNQTLILWRHRTATRPRVERDTRATVQLPRPGNVVSAVTVADESPPRSPPPVDTDRP